METTLRMPLGCVTQSVLELLHFVRRLWPAGVVGPSLPGHALALTSATDTTTAGTFPSRRVVLHGVRLRGARLALRHSGPLGLPLRSRRFRRWLIRRASP